MPYVLLETIKRCVEVISTWQILNFLQKNFTSIRYKISSNRFWFLMYWTAT